MWLRICRKVVVDHCLHNHRLYRKNVCPTTTSIFPFQFNFLGRKDEKIHQTHQSLEGSACIIHQHSWWVVGEAGSDVLGQVGSYVL